MGCTTLKDPSLWCSLGHASFLNHKSDGSRLIVKSEARFVLALKRRSARPSWDTLHLQLPAVSTFERDHSLWTSVHWCISQKMHEREREKESKRERAARKELRKREMKEMNYRSVLREISLSSATRLKLAFSNRYGALSQVTYPACTGALQYDSLPTPLTVIPKELKPQYIQVINC